MNREAISLSKFLSYVLRHRPDSIGLSLDEEGWANINALLGCAAQHGRVIDLPQLQEVVATNDKKRFAISEDGGRIRASQGHSLPVDLALSPLAPPDLLYHGSATRFLDSIRADGLVAGSRQHVHLSPDRDTAIAVGRRHGQPVVLVIRAQAMAEAGHLFFQSANGVWLTDHVPVDFIDFQNVDSSSRGGCS